MSFNQTKTAVRDGFGSITYRAQGAVSIKAAAVLRLRAKRKQFITDIIIGCQGETLVKAVSELLAFRVVIYEGSIESDPNVDWGSFGNDYTSLFPFMPFFEHQIREGMDGHIHLDGESFVKPEGTAWTVILFAPFFVVKNIQTGSALNIGDTSTAPIPFTLTVLGVDC